MGINFSEEPADPFSGWKDIAGSSETSFITYGSKGD